MFEQHPVSNALGEKIAAIKHDSATSSPSLNHELDTDLVRIQLCYGLFDGTLAFPVAWAGMTCSSPSNRYDAA